MSKKRLVAMKSVVSFYLKNIAIGHIMRQIIREEFIAPLQDALEDSETEKEMEAIKKRIGQFEDLDDPNWWNGRAYFQARKHAKKFHIPSQNIEDLVSQVGLTILERTDEIKRHRSFKKIDPFDFNQDPHLMRKIFTMLVHGVVIDTIDKLKRKSTPEWMDERSDFDKTKEEDDPIDYHDTLSDVYIEDFMNSIVKYVSPKLHGRGLLLFNAWLDAVEIDGVSTVNWKRDVWERVVRDESRKQEKQLSRKGLSESAIKKKMSTFVRKFLPYVSSRQVWNTSVMPLIIAALERAGVDVRRRRKEIKAFDVFVKREYFRRLSNWVLGKAA